MKNSDNKTISGSKSAGQEVQEKQSAIDKAANRARKEDIIPHREDKRNRGRRDHSEKRS